MSEVRVTEEHAWLRLEDDGSVTVGITGYAQEQLGDIVFIELPQVGQTVSSGDEAAVIESVKAAGDVSVPVSGTVLEINDKLADAPELVNSDPLGDGWFFRLEVEDTSELQGLMSEDDYREFIAGL